MHDIKIETFIAVCNCMNFTHAAENLNMTQPAVSKQMKILEEYYNVKLFKYEGKKMFLTNEGKKLLKYAKAIIADEKKLLKDLQFKDKKILCFGSTPTPGEFIIPKYLKTYLEKNNISNVNMYINNTEILLSKLDFGEIDFAIVEGNFEKSNYEYLCFSKQTYFPVCSNTININCNSIENIINKTLILREKGSGNREILEHILKRHNISINDFKSKIEVNNISAQKSLVINGCGIAFLFEAIISEEIKNKIIKKIDINGFHLEHEINFIWRKNSVFRNDYLKIFNYFYNILKKQKKDC